MSERILILQLKRIGDFLLTLPAIHEVRRQHPNAEIVVVVNRGLQELAASVSYIDRVLVWGGFKQKAQCLTSLVLGKWNLLLDFTGNDRSALFSRLSQAQQRVGYQKFANKAWRRGAYNRLIQASVRDLHTVDFHLALLGDTTLQSRDTNIELDPLRVLKICKPWWQQAFPQVQWQQPYVVVHPGTARLEKFWQDERWAEVLRYLHDTKQVQVLVTGTGAGLEAPTLAYLRTHVGHCFVDLTGQLSLVDLNQLIAGAKLVIGVDSMAMHMAALWQCPQIALFGPTNPYHWRARHSRSIVLQGENGCVATMFSPKAAGVSMQAIQSQAVVEAIESLM